MRKIAIIPAKAGSHRLENKNSQEIGNWTLLQLAVKCAQEAALFDKIIVTTNIPVICPDSVIRIERPPELCTPTSDTWSAVDHVAKECDITREDLICLLQPTSPFRSPADIKMILKLQELMPYCRKFYTTLHSQPNGAVYLTRLGDYNFRPHEVNGTIMPPERSLDINTEYDLNHARALLAYEKANPGTFDIWHPELP